MSKPKAEQSTIANSTESNKKYKDIEEAIQKAIDTEALKLQGAANKQSKQQH